MCPRMLFEIVKLNICNIHMYYVYVIHNSHHVKLSAYCEHFSVLHKIGMCIAGC
jgi:hypothetical protein